MNVTADQSKTFRERVLAVVARIPRGKVVTYGEVARRAGNRNAARAVGSILKTNYNPGIPCHRVIRSNGNLGGYNRGTPKKRALLVREGAIRGCSCRALRKARRPAR